MSTKRKPLDDARRRVNEKLNAIEEQTEFIQQSIDQLITGVRKTAQNLLGETSKTKFFNKYRAVSQELEKCLDDLLLISATISSLDDKDDEEEDEESDEDEDGNNVEEEPRKIQEVVPERNGSCTTERITPSSSLQKPLIVVLEVKEEVVTELKKEVVPEVKEKVVPEVKEKVVPDLKNEVVPCLKEEVVPDLKDEVVPCLKDEVAPDLKVEVVPVFKAKGVPELKDEVVPEFKEKLVPELKEEVVPTKLVELQLPAVITQTSEAVPIESEATTVAVNEKPLSPIDLLAGDLIEEALKDESHEFIDKQMKEKGLQIPPFKFPEVFSLEVIVTEITSPCEFWIQQINGDLDLLMEEMCFFFSKRAKAGDKGGMNKSPSVGDVCCAKSTQDDIWYRALVTAVSGEEDTVEVLYVDEGNGEGLPLSRLRPLEEKFRKLPCQALCCELGGVKLNGETKLKEVNDWFKRRVAGEALEAVLAEKGTADKTTPSFPPGVPVAIDLYIRPPSTTATTRVDSLKLEYNLHEMMIREGFSRRALSPEETMSVSPSSSHSDVRSMTKTESVRSTSTTSGFHEDSSCTGDPPVYPQSKPQDVSGRGYQVEALIPHRIPPPVIPVDSDGSLYMLMSHVFDPGEFYVHFITSEAGKLDTLMEEMKKTYEESDLRDNSSHADHFSPRVGDFCCAKFTGDGNWYRAVVLQARSSLNKSDGVEGSGERKTTINVEVFYIDFGNIESLGVENLRDLLPRFMGLPAQVVRCSLADVEPLAKCIAGPDEVFVDTPANTSVFPDAIQHGSISHPPSAPRRSPRNRSHRKNPRRHRPRPSAYDIAIAAGDEDPNDDLLDTFFLAKAPRPKTPTRSSISEDIDKSHRTPSLLSDTAVELFQRVWSKDASMVSSSWSSEATEFFKRLTEDPQRLVGFLVPWDSQMVNNIVNYCQGSECSLPNLGPVLRLNLYDVSGDEDIFINGAMVKGKYATSSTIIQEEETTKPDMDVKECEQVPSEVSSHSDTPVVKVNQQELTDMAHSLNDSKVSPSSSADSSKSASPKSPTLNLLEAWNPMSHEYQSFRNAYNVKTDNLDVAITGYEEDRGKICPFYRSKYGCFQGSKCPNKHVQQDITGHVCIYGARSYMSVVLPEIGAWVAVKVTAIYDPRHFWVQLPFGREPIDSQIIKNRSGKETSGEEHLKDLDDLMKRMNEFYSKTFRRERSLAPVAEGELVVLRYKKDKRWYRGKVCLERGDKYQVCFVDYGFSDWINKNDVCPMVPHFLHLPFQAVECFLANIKPTCDVPDKDSVFIWSKDSKRRFESLTEDKVLVCQILSTGSNDTMLVNLFDTAEGNEVNISQVMIDSGFAKEADFKISQPLNFSSPLDTDSWTVLKLPG